MIDIVIGIDPGKSGGIAVCVNGAFSAYKMPTEEQLAGLIEFIIKDHEYSVICYLEKVHSMPKQGVKSTFTFGQGYGFLRGVLRANKIPIRDVTPQAWMKALNCRTKGNKNVTKNKAQSLFPNIKVTHAIADSLLICTYGVNLERRKGSL